MPDLGGLFAGGMPTLKKSTGTTSGRPVPVEDERDIRRESTDWFGRLASHAPAEESSSANVASEPTTLAHRPEAPVAIAHTIPHLQTPADVKDTSLEDKVDFTNGYRAKTLWSYVALAPDQLSFGASDYLLAYPSLEVDNVDWVYGVSEQDEGKAGWLPKAYIQQVPG